MPAKEIKLFVATVRVCYSYQVNVYATCSDDAVENMESKHWVLPKEDVLLLEVPEVTVIDIGEVHEEEGNKCQ